MSKCFKCGKYEDYTDQFAVWAPDGTAESACWNCFKAMGCPDYFKTKPKKRLKIEVEVIE